DLPFGPTASMLLKCAQCHRYLLECAIAQTSYCNVGTARNGVVGLMDTSYSGGEVARGSPAVFGLTRATACGLRRVVRTVEPGALTSAGAVAPPVRSASI